MTTTRRRRITKTQILCARPSVAGKIPRKVNGPEWAATVRIAPARDAVAAWMEMSLKVMRAKVVQKFALNTDRALHGEATGSELSSALTFLLTFPSQ